MDVMRTGLGLLLLFCAVPALAGQPEGWWDASWAARRSIEIKPTGATAPGAETGWVEFRGMGRLAPDGQDVRIVVDGQPVPMKVLHAGTDDRCVVAFRLPREARRCYVYFGNPKAPKLTASWEPERGLWLETRAFNGGTCQTWDQMKQLMARSGPTFGAGPVLQVHRAGNSFSTIEKYVSTYKGVLTCAEAGEYTFCTDSRDASFLFVDDKLVVQAPGWHGAEGRARITAKLQLASGAHRFEYCHVCANGGGIAAAYWQTPSGKRFEPIAAFSSAAAGQAGALELSVGTAVDFEVKLVEEAYIEDRTLLRYRFRVLAPAGAGETTWDFGDGQAATGREVDHIFFRDAVFSVTCKVVLKGQPSTVTSPCAIHPDFERNPERQKGDARKYMESVRRYAWNALDMASLQAASGIYALLEDPEGQIATAQALLGRPKTWDALYFEQAMRLQQLLREVRKAPDEALNVLAAAEERLKSDKNLRAKVLLEIGDVYYFDKGDLDRALLEYDKVVGRYSGLEDRTVRLTHIRIGDIMRDRGNYEKAAQRYAEAERIRVEKWTATQAPMRQGAVLHAIEDFTRRADAVQARKWVETFEWEFPMERLRGQSAIFRARIALLEKNPVAARKALEILVRVNPESPYVGEALLMLAQLALDAKDHAKARELLTELVEKHPESEVVPKAREMMEKQGWVPKTKTSAGQAEGAPPSPEAKAKHKKPPDGESELSRKGRRRKEDP